MSDETLKELDSKIYCAVTKIRNNRKHAEINTIHNLFSRTLLKVVYKIELMNY